MIRGLYVIIDPRFSKYPPLELARFVLAGGCRIIQLRVKSPSSCQQPATSNQFLKAGDTVLDTGRAIMGLKRGYDFTFIINDYVDAAREINADGVHVGRDDLSVTEVRKILGPGKIIGYSSHSFEEAAAAEKAGADYVAFGAIYPTKTKGPGHPVQGLARLKEVVAALKVPVVAIGGINKANIDEVIATGVASAAMITGVSEAEDVVGEVRWLVKRLKR